MKEFENDSYHIAKKLLVVVLLLGIVMLMPMVSALGEVKEFTAPTKGVYQIEGKDVVDKYGSIAIYDNWKLPLISNKVLEYKLIDNTDICNYYCNASGTVETFFEVPIFEDIIFKTRLGGTDNAAIEYQIYIKEKGGKN